MIRLKKTGILFYSLIILMFSCQNFIEKNESKDSSEQINLEIIIHPVDNPIELRYKFEVDIDSLKGVDFFDENYSITSKSLKLNNEQIEKIKSLSGQILYKKPFEDLITDALEIKIKLNSEIIHHQRGFGRGNGPVDALLDYIFDLLEIEIRIFSFSR